MGNIRATITDQRIKDGNFFYPSITNASEYYPFGMQTDKSFALAGKENRFGYNGKENDRTLEPSGGVMDYGARLYDGRIGRWRSLDPLAKKYPSLSEYCSVANNPIRLIDSDGRVITIPDGKGGSIVYVPGMSFEGIDDNTAKTIKYLNDINIAKTAGKLTTLSESNQEYSVQLGSSSDVGWAKGGVTSFDFDGNKVEIKVVEDGDVTYAILGDEITHAVQFDKGDLGLSKSKKGVPGSFGYDLKDEGESKFGAVDALNSKGIKAAHIDPLGTYESTPLMQIIQDGTFTEKDANDWLQSTNDYFDALGKSDRNTMDKSLSAKDNLKNARGNKTYRDEGKTIIIK